MLGEKVQEMIRFFDESGLRFLEQTMLQNWTKYRQSHEAPKSRGHASTMNWLTTSLRSTSTCWLALFLIEVNPGDFHFVPPNNERVPQKRLKGFPAGASALEEYIEAFDVSSEFSFKNIITQHGLCFLFSETDFLLQVQPSQSLPNSIRVVVRTLNRTSVTQAHSPPAANPKPFFVVHTQRGFKLSAIGTRRGIWESRQRCWKTLTAMSQAN